MSAGDSFTFWVYASVASDWKLTYKYLADRNSSGFLVLIIFEDTAVNGKCWSDGSIRHF
jgi:hypothetical protein